MRSKKESAVSTRLSEAPTAHSSTAIAAALPVAKQRAERCWRGGGSALFRLHGFPVFFPLRRRHCVRLVGVRVWRSCGITQRGSACQSEAHGRGHESRRAVAASAPAAMTTLCAARGADCPLRTERRALQRALFRFLPCREPCSCPQALPPSHHRTCVAHSLWASTGVEGR